MNAANFVGTTLLLFGVDELCRERMLPDPRSIDARTLAPCNPRRGKSVQRLPTSAILTLSDRLTLPCRPSAFSYTRHIGARDADADKDADDDKQC